MPSPDLSAARPSPLTWRDSCAAAAIFCVAFSLFWHAPMTSVGDSKYTLLLTQSLLSRGSFLLDGYGLPYHPLPTTAGYTQDGNDYQIEIFNGHLYDYFPPGSAILSAPFVVIADGLGFSTVGPDHRYDLDHEIVVQRAIAALLMAGLAVTFYLTGRLFLPVGWSALIALGGVLGTQVWSTASRGLWTHTWGIALLGVVLYLLAAQETGRRKLNPWLLATLLSWTYFVRPTNSLFIIGITIYLLLYYRALFLAYAVTGAAWFAAFIIYSWTHFGRLLPNYYQGARLHVATFWEALTGNLVSPSRGVLLYVPLSLFVLYLVVRYWRWQPHRRLVFLTAGVSACHLLAVSCFIPWYAGECYGPRYMTELVPWFVLLAVLGTRAACSFRADWGQQPSPFAWGATLAAGGFLLLLSGWIHWRGATLAAPDEWNHRPVGIDSEPGRVWDWRHPQILAGLTASREPAVFPVVDGHRVAFGNGAGDAFLWDGWSPSEAEFCWTQERWATLVFTAEDLQANHLRLSFEAYLFPKSLRRQRVDVRLNDHRVAVLNVDQPSVREYDLALPAGALQHRNVLTFRLPDAASPKALEGGKDDRTLGIALRWLELTR